MTSIIADNCYGRGLKCSIMSNFLEMPIDGRFLSSDIEFQNMCRMKFNNDTVNIPFDLVQSVDLSVEHEFYKGDGIAKVNYLNRRNNYGEHR